MERSTIIVIVMLIAIAIIMATQSFEKEFIKLESDTWYYQYEINKELHLSKTKPMKDSEESRNWYHPEKGYKCLGGFYVADPEESGNIGEWSDYGENFRVE